VTGTGVKGQAARIEECVASEGGCLYSLYCLEEVFSETHLKVIERLCAQVPKTRRWQPHSHTSLLQHIVGLIDIQGRQLARPRSDGLPWANRTVSSAPVLFWAQKDQFLSAIFAREDDLVLERTLHEFTSSALSGLAFINYYRTGR
jgi:hypothetical protein